MCLKILKTLLFFTVQLQLVIGVTQEARVIGNVVDSITEPRKNNYKHLFIMAYKNYNFINTV